MNNALLTKIVIGIVAVAAIGLIAANMSGVFNSSFSDGGVDVRKTACEDLLSARRAIADELSSRKQTAANTLAADKDKASDDYWTENRRLEDDYHQCISAALTADPCKEPFEEVGKLYEEIMADFEADKGFNEAKFNEREAAKKRYNDCVEQARKPEFFEEKQIQCDSALANGQQSNQQNRTAVEATVQSKYDTAIASADNAYRQKSAILDAIEAKCNEPGGNTNVMIGGLTTTGSGAQIQANSSACTGLFSGNNPELQKQINDLENQLQKAKAAGQTDGLFGTSNIQSSLDRLRQELKESERSCTADADCGNTEPVCCTGTQVGRAFCDNGTCASEKTDCVDPQICAGKPAQCVGAAEGAQQQDGIYISRTIPEEGTCSQNLQVLNLAQATPESVRYSLNGNIPGWLNIDKPGGSLPGNVNVTYSCNTVQKMGPGNYTVNASITVYNAANELINTIPFNVSITVTPVQKMVDVIDVGGKLIPVSEVHRFKGPECDEEEHWHTNSGTAKALDGSTVPDTSECGYGKTKSIPVISVPDTRFGIEVRMNGF